VTTTAASLRISLVVPLRNEEESLEALIQSIQQQTRPPDEVILVDGGSVDRTVERARALVEGDPCFRVIEAGPATPGRGRNVGIEAAAHDWIALTDAGIRLDPHWLEQLARVAEQSPQADVVHGNFEPRTDTWFRSCAALVYVMPRQQRDRGLMRGPFIASTLLRRDAWRRVDGFPDLRAAEDLIFMERLQQQGCKIAWAPEATVCWETAPTLSRTFGRFVLYSRHNVWAGRQSHWHHGLARQYLVVLCCLALAAFHNALWLLLLPMWLLARVGKTLWSRRENRGIFWLLEPARFATCTVILLTIDLATFVGWSHACWSSRPN
jgi:glycosyltransferase involved in cell wall biosynthesis